jgi:hypothetical protein
MRVEMYIWFMYLDLYLIFYFECNKCFGEALLFVKINV